MASWLWFCILNNSCSTRQVDSSIKLSTDTRHGCRKSFSGCRSLFILGRARIDSIELPEGKLRWSCSELRDMESLTPFEFHFENTEWHVKLMLLKLRLKSFSWSRRFIIRSELSPYIQSCFNARSNGLDWSPSSLTFSLSLNSAIIYFSCRFI